MGLIPWEIVSEAITLLGRSLVRIREVHSPRAMSFIIKGLYYYRQAVNTPKNLDLVRVFADRLVQVYQQESPLNRGWFEGSLSYSNSVFPEGMLYAWLLTGDKEYKEIAISSMDFLLSQTFTGSDITVIPNKQWSRKGHQDSSAGGEQPIDAAYTIMMLHAFYSTFGETGYKTKMEKAFSWFLGNNRLNHIVYNPCTTGCYDGLEEFHVNLNQGAESTVSYLMARLTLEATRQTENPVRSNAYMSSLVLKS
jgi:hypothetical protein